MEVSSPQTNPKKPQENFGPMVGIVIIVALIAAGGIYFLLTKEFARQMTPPPGQEQAHL